MKGIVKKSLFEVWYKSTSLYTVIQKASFCDRLMDGLKDGQDLMYKQLCLSCQQATAVLCNLSKSDVMWNFMETCVYILAQNF